MPQHDWKTQKIYQKVGKSESRKVGKFISIKCRFKKVSKYTNVIVFRSTKIKFRKRYFVFLECVCFTYKTQHP
jgi:tRNA 2-selenouridine synthase SelU